MANEVARPLRGCDVCGGVDDHPRHVYDYAPGDAVTPDEVATKMLDNAPAEAKAAIFKHIRDDSTAYRHMDCCREAGCPDGTCDQMTAGAESLKGDALVKHLSKGV